jgi:hypothetical protein
MLCVILSAAKDLAVAILATVMGFPGKEPQHAAKRCRAGSFDTLALLAGSA